MFECMEEEVLKMENGKYIVNESDKLAQKILNNIKLKPNEKLIILDLIRYKITKELYKK